MKIVKTFGKSMDVPNETQAVDLARFLLRMRWTNRMQWGPGFHRERWLGPCLSALTVPFLFTLVTAAGATNGMQWTKRPEGGEWREQETGHAAVEPRNFTWGRIWPLYRTFVNSSQALEAYFASDFPFWVPPVGDWTCWMGHRRGCGKSLWGLLTLFTCSLCYLQFCIWLSFEPAFEIQRSTTRRVWSWLQRQRHQQLLEPQDVFFLFGCPAHFDKTPPKKCCVLAGCLSKWCLIRMLQLDRELQLLHGRQSQVLGHHPAVAVMRRNMLWWFCISLENS